MFISVISFVIQQDLMIMPFIKIIFLLPPNIEEFNELQKSMDRNNAKSMLTTNNILAENDFSTSKH